MAVQYSGDGVNWSTLYVYFGLPWSGANGASLTLNAANAAPLTIGISWRLRVTADAASQSTSIAELAWYDNTSTQINTSTQYAALTSSTEGTVVSVGMNAYDGNSSSFWSSANIPSSGSPEWLGYRFASSAVTPASFTITPRSSSFTQAPSAFKLQYSTDEVTWTDAGTFTATWSSATPQTFTTGLLPPGRFLIITGMDGGMRPQLKGGMNG
jgi:hypothetical protein